jgi:hypothetical protein
MATDSIQGIASRLVQDGHDVVGVGILESAGRKGGSLADILRSHALSHRADGDHFRSAFAAAATRCGLAVSRVRARDLEAEAATAIGRSPETQRQVLKDLGRTVGPPWGADQKAAALLMNLPPLAGPVPTPPPRGKASVGRPCWYHAFPASTPRPKESREGADRILD